MIGGRDFQLKALETMEIPYTIIQLKDELTDYCIDNANDLYIMDYTDIDKTLQLSALLHQFHHFEAVVAYREFAQVVAGRVAELLDINTNCNFNAVMKSRDKLAMREQLALLGLNNVGFKSIETEPELVDFYHNCSGKIIVKPSDGVGSQGVYLVESEAQCRSAYQHAKSFGANKLIAEEFIGGEEFSVEACSKSGVHRVIAITRKITTGAPHFVEKGHDQPAKFEPQISARIEQTISNLLDAITHKNGPTHTEIKVCDGQVYIIETHIRIGGDSISDLTRMSTGFDMFEQTLAHLLKIDLPEQELLSGSSSIRFFTPQAGVLESIEGEESVRATQGVVALNILSKVGSEVGSVKESYDRAGYVITFDQEGNRAQKIAEQCQAQIKFNVKQHSFAEQ